MTTPPRITIVTPSFNQAPYLEATIRSVLDQGYPNLQYIVVDGGSTDGSLDIIKKYAGQIDWWTSEPDRGQSHAINKGLAQSTGQIENWLNSDDMLVPGALWEVARRFADDPYLGLLMGRRVRIDAQGDLVGVQRFPIENLHWDMLAFGFYPPQESTFWRANLRAATTPVREDLHFTMDFDWYLRLSRGARVAQTDCYLGAYRLHPDQKSENRRQQSETLAAARDDYLRRECRPYLAWKAAVHAYYKYNRRRGRVCPFTVTPLAPGTSFEDLPGVPLTSHPEIPAATAGC